MNDNEFYNGLDKIFEDILPQAGKLCLQDIGLLNNVLIELRKRRTACQTKDSCSENIAGKR